MLLPSEEVKNVFNDEDIPNFAFDCKLNSNMPKSESSSQEDNDKKTHHFFFKPPQNKRDAKASDKQYKNETKENNSIQFTEVVFKQKALDEAKTLLEEQGFHISDKVSRSLAGAVNQSRTSSVVLFGEKVGSNNGNKKRETKATDKDDMRSEHSGKTNKTSKSGRFEAKYKVGDITSNGATIKEVKEEDWKFVERDKKGNGYYKCLKCQNEKRVLKSNRKIHACK
jgi:hypothetical protein